MVSYQYSGVKKIGHGLKRILPVRFFRIVLLAYHGIIDIVALPKIWMSMIRVRASVKRLRKLPGPVRFGFYVVIEQMFQLRCVFELMLKDERFEPFIVVVPRIGWQKGDTEETVEKTYATLKREYPTARIYKGIENGLYDNHLEECGACAMMNLYRGLADSRFETEYFARRGVPIFGAAYFYLEGTFYASIYYGMSSIGYVCRFYCSNDIEQECCAAYQGVRFARDKTSVVGCSKADPIEFVDVSNAPRKTVLIAPHHTAITTVDCGLHHGNFLRYKDFLKDLPKRYPEIHWIFRPHPHLQLRLVKEAGWSMEQWNAYVRDFTSTLNAEYESSGSYYDSFARSDAMIQDCGSFLPEYFYTGKPQCYMILSEESKREQFGPWGQELLAHTYQAFSEEDITRFIDDVVIGGKDTMREMRHKFAKERVMINYPHASEAILEDIAEMLGRGKGKSA